MGRGALEIAQRPIPLHRGSAERCVGQGRQEMGRAQHNAVQLMKFMDKRENQNPDTTRCRAAMCIRDRSNNVWKWQVDSEYFDNGDHVETKLFNFLIKKYPKGLPQYPIVVIYINFSPRQDCLSNVINKKVPLMKGWSSQLKIFYRRGYIKGSMGFLTASSMWDSEEQMRNTYDTAEQNAGMVMVPSEKKQMMTLKPVLMLRHKSEINPKHKKKVGLNKNAFQPPELNLVPLNQVYPNPDDEF
ncbi:MAG: hypothetical protein IT557_01490 [Alphaproteobacteria bacterium]|nr:hypothetical protein [Alphaproteobacteria bacterium]